MNDNMREGYEKWVEEGKPTKSREQRFKENPTRKLAIILSCIDCMGGEGNPGYQKLIRECQSSVCRFVQFRPYQ